MSMVGEELLNLINTISRRYHIDPNLTYAIVATESTFKPKALSKKGAKGLMQLSPLIARAYGVNDPYDPEQNIEGGVRFLSYLLSKYKGDEEKALAHYVSGYKGAKNPRMVGKYLRKISSYRQTQPFPLYPKEVRYLQR